MDWEQTDVDLPVLLSRKYPELKGFRKVNFKNILLCFDYDCHDPFYSPEKLNAMQKLFSDPTDNGKLYLNYPMLESYCHCDLRYKEAFLEGADTSGEIIKKSVNWGVNSGEELFKGGKYLVTPFAAVGGTVAGGGYLVYDSVANLFRKGKTTVITKGQKFGIMLLEPLDVPVY